MQHMHKSRFGEGLSWARPLSVEESRRNVFAYSQHTQFQSLLWGFAALHEVSDTPKVCVRNPQAFVLARRADSRAGSAAGICLTRVEV